MAGALAADTPAGGGIAVYPGNPFYNVKIYGARPGRLVRTALVGHLPARTGQMRPTCRSWSALHRVSSSRSSRIEHARNLATLVVGLMPPFR